MTNYFGLVVAKDSVQTLAGLEDLAHRFSVSTHMDHGCIFAEENICSSSNLIHGLLGAEGVASLLNVLTAKLFMVPDILEVVTIEVQSRGVVRIDLDQSLPVFAYFLRCRVDLLSVVVQNVKIWHHGSQMGPELTLQIAHFLHGLLHLLEKSFKLDHIAQLWVHILMILVVLLEIVFYNVFVSKYRKLLLN